MRKRKIQQFMKILEKLDMPTDMKDSIIGRLSTISEVELNALIRALPTRKSSVGKRQLESRFQSSCNNLKEKMEGQNADKILEDI